MIDKNSSCKIYSNSYMNNIFFVEDLHDSTSLHMIVQHKTFYSLNLTPTQVQSPLASYPGYQEPGYEAKSPHAQVRC